MIEKSEIKKIIREVLEESNNSLGDGVHVRATILFEEIGWSVQDQCIIALETMLKREFGMSKTMSEDVATKAIRLILPYLKSDK